MKVQIQGKGEVTLSKTHFVAEGGEGQVYARGNTGFKVYHDPGKAIPLGKIKELALIASPNVITPRDLILKVGRRQQHIGHTFRFVADTWTLCQLFPRVFREREGFSHDKALQLVRKIQEETRAVHKGGVLIVDGNEMNYLVSRDFTTPFLIDTDSYQTKGYPATAIMPSVRDWQTPVGDFTELSDWFSFAIVSFQLFVGIHPYKGKHPSIKGFEDRMKQGVSIFHQDVKVPKVCYPLDVIPEVYRDWYHAVLEEGKRLPPPEDLQATIVLRPVIRTIQGTDVLDFTEVDALGAPIRTFAVYANTAREVAHAGDRAYVDRRPVPGTFEQPFVVGFTPKMNRPIAATNNAGKLRLWDLVWEREVPTTLNCSELTSYDGRIYVRTRDKILEVTLTETSTNQVFAGTHLVANVLENASRLYEGLALQNLLGEPYVSLFPTPKTSYQVHIPELRRHKIVQAKFDNNVLMVLAAENGAYHRYVFRFDGTYSKYDVRKVEDVSPTGLNFVVLDTNICVCLTEDETLEVFSNRMGSKSLKTVEDPMIGGDMKLFKSPGRVMVARGNKLYTMRMK